MSRVAVIGAGISALTAAWLLSRRYDVVLLEKDDRLGGHTHTHALDTRDGRLALDTGFIVHNTRTYPRLVRLFNELGVTCRDSDMSFGVTSADGGYEYSTRSVGGLFAQRRNLVRPRHYKLLIDILRFNREARRFARALDEHPLHGSHLTLGEFLRDLNLTGDVVDRYLAPLASAIWSAPAGGILDFPAATLIRFFDQHGMNTTLDHPTWRVVEGGSSSYISKLVASPNVTARTGAGVEGVRRLHDHVEIRLPHREIVAADAVVFACHGDEVLPILEDASTAERSVLSAFRTTRNEAVLHTDASWLPRRAAARAAWNYLVDDRSGAATVTYHLNRLQGLNVRDDYCVTLNPTRAIAPYSVLGRMTYTHPLYTLDAIAAQERWATISGHRRTHFCGAYWFYGFHEDGVRSAVRVAESLGISW